MSILSRMSESEKSSELGLTSDATDSTAVDHQAEVLPAPETLQFRKAEHKASEAVSSGPSCVICAKRIGDSYFHAQGQVVCPECAAKVQAVQHAPPAHTLLKSFVYGLGAALAGTAIFSIIWIVTDYQLSLIAILIGYLVGKAVRSASKGLGGRPQQILAVVLTYFSITASYIPVAIYHQMHDPKAAESSSAAGAASGQNSMSPSADGNSVPKPKEANASTGMALIMMVGISLAAPFLSLSEGVGGLLTLVIIFFGLQRAWRMTGRSNVAVMGPYQYSS